MGVSSVSEVRPGWAAGVPETLFKNVVEHCADAVVIANGNGRIVYLNQMAQNMFGLSLRRALGKSLDILIPTPYRKTHKQHVETFGKSGKKARHMGDRTVRTYGLRADGTEFPTDISIMRADSESGPVFVAMVRDISEQVDMQNRLEALANTDPLTGVSNRRAFLERAEQELAEARRYGNPLSAAMIDIDRFKALNDRFGHAIGDQVLQQVARQLATTLRKPDIFARWGGEEFICLLPHTDATLAQSAAERLRRAIEALEAAASARVTVSIGVTSLVSADSEIETLIDRADQALYEAKRAGRNKVALHQPADTAVGRKQSAA
jgi:diguanylate cyclase (GGDEF)-like protein/PAS domain S-box-containing protein